MPGKNRHFGRDFPWLPNVGAPALPGVFALGVFADDDPVEVAGAGVAKGGGDAAEDFCGADVGVLLEGLADGEAQGPEGYVVGNVC